MLSTMKSNDLYFHYYIVLLLYILLHCSPVKVTAKVPGIGTVKHVEKGKPSSDYEGINKFLHQ